MITSAFTSPNIQLVSSFEELISRPFQAEQNAMGWIRDLQGDFAELVQKFDLKDDLMNLEPEQLEQLNLSVSGQKARATILEDFIRLKALGSSPNINLIKKYSSDVNSLVFPRDVYSFHVDQSPIPTHTFLCTYYGPSSEVLPNKQAEKKVQVPELRHELQQLYQGADAGFETFLRDEFYDLHYQAKPNGRSIPLGTGNLWRLAVDHPESRVPPCIHRAPEDVQGQVRLLLIC
ncbi:MAG: hypothetical protein JNK73_14200 [Bacteroidia bacterium]|nr:hypothetical protein [Bacteroidia bacterium]